MATRLLLLLSSSQCGFKPLPKLYSNSITRTSISGYPNSITSSRSELRPIKVSAPVGVHHIIEKDEKVVNGSESIDVSGFNPGAPPRFTLADIRAAIPKYCWVKDPWRSMSYVVRDVAVVLGLSAVAAYANSMVVWPLYWFAQGTMFGLCLFLVMIVAMEAFLIMQNSMV